MAGHIWTILKFDVIILLDRILIDQPITVL